MSTVIITDSACELPDSIENSKSVLLLPINLVLGDQNVKDTFESAEILSKLARNEITKKQYANSDPATKEQIIEFLKEEILPRYDYAIVQTVSSSHSNQYEMWLDVKRSFGPQFRDYRPAGRRNFSLSIIDSGAAYSGQGLLALETIRLARKASSKRDLIVKMKEFYGYIQSYSAPHDLQYLRERALQRGDNSVNFFSALIGKLLSVSPVIFGMRGEVGLSAQARGHETAINIILKHAIDATRKGLKSPFINVTYGGPLAELEKISMFQELKDVALQYDATVFTSVARLSSIINLGPKNFSLSLASEDPDFVIKNAK